MSDHHEFLAEVRASYLRVIKRTLEWMLARPRLSGAFLNTKQNSITLRDYDSSDGWRAPDILYGWIQGRGLEALITFARFFAESDPDLSKKLIEMAGDLYRALAALHARHGHGYFTYDGDLNPVFPGPDGARHAQATAGDILTYSDIFVVKGLVVASTHFAPSATGGHLRDLDAIVRAVEDNRFLLDEKQKLEPATLARQDREYGPRLIMIGAAATLRRFGFAKEAAFSDRFIAHVIEHHMDNDPASRAYGLLRDAEREDRCNPGHATEFVGLSLGERPEAIPVDLLDRMQRILNASFAAGFSGPGLRLGVSASTGAPLSEFFPWWSLPETVRAAALVYQRTRDPAALEIWRKAHAAFFAHYWRDEARLAYQMRTKAGPIDHAPATPDLDPGYHTGLSFLTAIEIVNDLVGEAWPASSA